jgi:predicted ATPase with chaperone activity
MTYQQEIETVSYEAPPIPQKIEETGITANFLRTLIVKAMSVYGLNTASDISAELRLARSIVNVLLEDAKDMALVEVLGIRGVDMKSELRYALTGKGRDWAIDALSQSTYVGPAPVNLTDFQAQIQKQRIVNETINIEALRQSFRELTMEQALVDRLGPAVNSGKSILLYGPPGNGKTSIAEAVATAFEQTIYVPYCIEVDGQVIKMFDATVHTEIPASASPSSSGGFDPSQPEQPDPRWVHCRRPVVITGGELTLAMLDLIFNPYSRYYEAPMQMKATGGIFVIDDFGRQLAKPQDVLNRWIVPLERGEDYLTLHTGKKFPVPFDELVVFSTNIPPAKLVDTASLRRLYYKIEIGAPTAEDYCTIFKNECEKHNIEIPLDLLPSMFEKYYSDGTFPLARYHPRFIVEQVLAICEYQGIPPHIDEKLVADAWLNLYTHDGV